MSNEKPFGLTARQKIQKGMTITREKIVPIEFDESRYDIVEVNVEIKDLDPVFHDYKIVNLSDMADCRVFGRCNRYCKQTGTRHGSTYWRLCFLYS